MKLLQNPITGEKSWYSDYIARHLLNPGPNTPTVGWIVLMEVDGDNELTDPELIAKAKALIGGEEAPPAPAPVVETPVDLSTGQAVVKGGKRM